VVRRLFDDDTKRGGGYCGGTSIISYLNGEGGVPTPVAKPEITPVAAFRVKPAGRLPWVIVQE